MTEAGLGPPMPPGGFDSKGDADPRPSLQLLGPANRLVLIIHFSRSDFMVKLSSSLSS